MDLLPTDEQEAVAGAAARLLSDRGYPGALRKLPSGTGIDAGLWAECADLGWLGLGLPESAGGVGLGAAAEVMLFRELGRFLAPGPFLATVIAAHAARACGDDATAAALVAGRLTAALGEVAGDSAVVAGAADPAVLVLTAGDGLRLCPSDALGPSEPVTPIDPAVVVSRCAVPAGAGVPVPAPVSARTALLSAAALVGIAEATRDMAVAHAKVRVQFGQPIGAFQAVKHRCADMAVRAEAAWAQVCFAAAALDGGRPDAARQAASAKVVAVEAGRVNAAGNVQVHGGMGFTEEHDAHLYVRRAHVYEVAGGSRRRHLAALVDRSSPPKT